MRHKSPHVDRFITPYKAQAQARKPPNLQRFNLSAPLKILHLSSEGDLKPPSFIESIPNPILHLVSNSKTHWLLFLRIKVSLSPPPGGRLHHLTSHEPWGADIVFRHIKLLLLALLSSLIRAFSSLLLFCTEQRPHGHFF